MKIKVKFKAFTYRGKLTYFIKTFNCPDFKIIPSKTLNGLILDETSIESQIVDWLDELDKSNLIIEKDLSCIIDYSIVVKTKKLTFKEYLISLNLKEEILFDILLIYREIKPLLKGKTFEKQLLIIMSHLEIGYKTANVAYQNMILMFNRNSSKDEIKLIDII